MAVGILLSMARKIRIEFEGALYHVMARGNQGRAIYSDDQDRKLWLETLTEACEKTGWHIHAYVLMGNHYHLLLETPEANLVAGMKWLQGTYTQRYNSRHKVFGHLFQGRYKALLVDGAGNYLAVVSTYIHLNPARAKLIAIGTEPLTRHGWSSYPAYVETSVQRPKWLVTERVLGSLGLGPENQKGYEAYLEGRVLELRLKTGREALAVEWKAIRRGWYLGSESFGERMLDRVKGALSKGRASSFSGEAKRQHGEAEAERLLALGLTALQLQPGELAGQAKATPEKQALAWWLCQHTTVTRRWVSQRVAMGDESRVTQAIRCLKNDRVGEWRRLKERLALCHE